MTPTAHPRPLPWLILTAMIVAFLVLAARPAGPEPTTLDAGAPHTAARAPVADWTPATASDSTPIVVDVPETAPPTSLVRIETEADDLVVVDGVTVTPIEPEPEPEHPVVETVDPLVIEVEPDAPCDYLDETGACRAFPPPPDLPDCVDTQGAEPCWFHGLPEGCTTEMMEADRRQPGCFPLAPELAP